MTDDIVEAKNENVQVIELGDEHEISDLMALLGGVGKDDTPELASIPIKPSRIIQALEQHRKLFTEFSNEEIESAEHCLVAAAIVLYKKSFQDIMNNNKEDQIKGVIDLAILFANVLPSQFSVAPKRAGRTGRQGGGYI